jgi:glutaredoxin-like YruB-family protein
MINKKVTVYSTPTCHYCILAKEFFKEKGVAYEEYNVGTDLDKRKEMVEKSGQMGVPVIDIEGDIIVGFDEDRVSKLLGI